MIDFTTRRRVRLNGRAHRIDGGLRLRAQQVYGNCPKYIQKRSILGGEPRGEEAASVASAALSARQQSWIRSADTFFIATAHREAGADASHRGGEPGFVQVESEAELIFPDYTGNTMFNTLGNIAANPHAGLLFIDFERGATLQLTGTPQIDWSATPAASFAGAERAIRYRVEQVIEARGVTSLRWRLEEPSPHNPRR